MYRILPYLSGRAYFINSSQVAHKVFHLVISIAHLMKLPASGRGGRDPVLSTRIITMRWYQIRLYWSLHNERSVTRWISTNMSDHISHRGILTTRRYIQVTWQQKKGDDDKDYWDDYKECNPLYSQYFKETTENDSQPTPLLPVIAQWWGTIRHSSSPCLRKSYLVPMIPTILISSLDVLK